MAFTAFVAFMRRLGWSSFCGIQSVCNVYGALGWDRCGITVFVLFMECWG